MKNLNLGVCYTNRESQSFNFYLNDLRMRERSLGVTPEYLRDKRAAFEQAQVDLILKGNAGAEEAKMKLFVSAQRLMISFAKAALVDGVELMDLINVGNATLWNYINTLQQPLECMLGTQVKKEVMGTINEAVQELKHIIKRPRGKMKVWREYKRLMENIQDPDFDFEHYIDVMCENEEVFEMARKNITVLSLDEEIEEGYTRCETVAADPEPDVFEVTDKSKRIIEIVHHITNLFEGNVFLALYGLNAPSGLTRSAVCEQYGITEKQATYIENKTLKRIRYSEYARELRELLA